MPQRSRTPSVERDPLLSNHDRQIVESPTDERSFFRRTSSVNGKKERLGPREVSRFTRYGILAGVFCASFLTAVNMTLVPTMLPSISSDFNKSHQASWLGTAYLLATCTFTPLYGRLADMLGRRGAVLTAIFFSGLGIIGCGLSRSMEQLIAARFVCGIGGGGLTTLTSIIASDLYSLRSRALTQSIASLFNGLGMGLGGPVGGLVTDWLGWRWAFLIQLPLYVVATILVSYFLNYVTPGKGKDTKTILKSIDYGGSFSLLCAVGSCLFFLSTRYNEGLPWDDPRVILPLTFTGVFAVVFVIVELRFAVKPVLEPSLLKQKIPVLVGMSNFLVANCNFSVTYFFPMWFQTVMLTSASVAGLHIMPNSLSMSCGSLFTGWMIHRTGKYKMLNTALGFLPFIGTLLILSIREDSGFWQKWFSIIPLGFGNAVVFQTVMIALLAHTPVEQVAVATGFGQLFRGIGQVGGVAISSAIFQYVLDKELKERITTPDADALIRKIRESARLVATLPPDLQRHARDSYAASLHAVFLYASVATFLSYLVRLPIPEKDLDSRPERVRRRSITVDAADITVDVANNNSGTSTPAVRDEEGRSVERR